MNQAQNNRPKNHLPTGNRIGADWCGPRWTPFAEAIAANYGVIVPWFFNTRVDLVDALSRFTTLTQPQQFDVLIFGAHIQGTAAQLPSIRLQITHKQSGVPWAVPNVNPFFPVTAIAGVNNNAMPNLKMPEVFFLPARTQLKLDWSCDPSVIGNIDPFLFTLIGMQLTIPHKGYSPNKIAMPDGNVIRADSRLPLFMTMGVGRRNLAGVFTSTAGGQDVQYLPPISCDIEIHDLAANFFSTFTIAAAVNITVKLTATGVENQWTPNYSPVTAVFGSETRVFPALPYCAPNVIPKGHRIQITTQNNNAAGSLQNGLFTFRGVKRCEY
jgi:hypothetical protein